MSSGCESTLAALRDAGAHARAQERLLRQAMRDSGDEETRVIVGVLGEAFTQYPDLRLLQLWERYNAPIGVRVAASASTAEAVRGAIRHLSSFGLARFALATGANVQSRAWIVASREGVQIRSVPSASAPPAELERHPLGSVCFGSQGMDVHLQRLMNARQAVADASGRWESAQATWSAQTRAHHQDALIALRYRHPWAIALRTFPDNWAALVGPGACITERLTPGFHPLSGDGWTAEDDSAEITDIFDVATLRSLYTDPLIVL